MDPALQLEKQVVVLAKSAFYHLHLICQLLVFLDSDDLAMLIHAFVALQLDFYHVLNFGLRLKASQKLHLAQHLAALLFLGLADGNIFGHLKKATLAAKLVSKSN